MGKYTAQIGGIGPFDIQSFSWAPQYASATSTSGETRAQISDVVVTRTGDAKGALLAQSAAAATLFSSATITTNDSVGPRVYTFTNVVISSFSASSANSGLSAAESMDWNFTQMTTNLSTYDDSSSDGAVHDGRLTRPK